MDPGTGRTPELGPAVGGASFGTSTLSSSFLDDGAKGCATRRGWYVTATTESPVTKPLAESTNAGGPPFLPVGRVMGREPGSVASCLWETPSAVGTSLEGCQD